ncbi:MAG: GNAT family N-acetyltransferase [Candidatus Ventricola sp.]|nr:GNAT family N-acetyltransferase [Candidatus Ventricola sp.]
MIIGERRIQLGGHELLLRCAREEDAQRLLDYLKTTSGETRFLIREPDEVTMTEEDERRFIRMQNESERDVMLLAFYDGEFAGNGALMGMGPSRYRHRAGVAIALFQAYTGLGIGRAMMEALLAIAREHGIEQVELEVVADNARAIALYKKLGFEVYGTMPRNMKYRDGTYANVYWMMKRL